MVIGGQFRPAGDRHAVVGGQSLRPVQLHAMAQHAEAAIRRHLDLVDAKETTRRFQVPRIRRISSSYHEDGGKQHGQPQWEVTDGNCARDQCNYRTPDDPIIGWNDRETLVQPGQRDDHNKRNQHDNKPGFVSLRPAEPGPRQRRRNHQKRVFCDP